VPCKEDTINQVQTVSVLIVDDQPPFRAVARTVVDLAPGFDVIGESETGEDAIEQAAALAPSLVLMDINLPGINGIEATRQIIGAAPSTVVILLSTYDADSLPGGADTSGAARYIHKEDFSPAVLRDVWDEASV
jgi:DNA-binding NarL/FixJ family response regulator